MELNRELPITELQLGDHVRVSDGYSFPWDTAIVSSIDENSVRLNGTRYNTTICSKRIQTILGMEIEMEIDITSFVTDCDAYEFSGSIAERGENAARETWANAKAQAKRQPLLSDEQLDEFRDYVRGFGAWEDEEIDSWDSEHCNTLFIQLVSGDMREAGMDDDFIDEFDWAGHEARANNGEIAGNIYRGDDGRIWYSLNG